MLTVLGASGFIGSHVCRKLAESGVEYFAPSRDEALEGRSLGDVIYCIGLTADFRSRPFDTMEAHVTRLLTLLREGDLRSILYVSSTRLYGSGRGLAREEDALHVSPLNPEDLYNTSKAAGESLALQFVKTSRVARLSNVYGNDFSSQNFLAAIIREAVASGKIQFRSSADTARDLVHVDDVAGALINIATRGTHPIYNVASGIQVTNRELANRIVSLTGCSVEFPPDAPRVSYRPVSIDLIEQEFGFRPGNVLSDLPLLIDAYAHEVAK